MYFAVFSLYCAIVIYPNRLKNFIMKAIKFFWMAVWGSLTLFPSCGNDDGAADYTGPIGVSQAVMEEFNRMFPDATDVYWETVDNYDVANFNEGTLRAAATSTRCAAWFSRVDHAWDMTDREIDFDLVPQAVRDAFSASEYGQSPWTVDDEANMLQRAGAETLYIIEADKNENNVETDVDLYYTEAGILVNEIIGNVEDDDHRDFLPLEPPTSISDWMAQHAGDARIIDVDEDDGCVEVEYIQDGLKHEAVFGTGLTWLYTKTDYDDRGWHLIPQAVLDALATSPLYTGPGQVDDAAYYETATQGFYQFELETRFDDDVNVYVSEAGELLDSRPSFGDGNSAVAGDLTDFIHERYPGAVVVERDWDDGFLEIEIRHEGREKDLYFNGRDEWLASTWEARLRDLPDGSLQMLHENGYYDIEDDDVDVLDTPRGLFYAVEAERYDDDCLVVLDQGGSIVKVFHDDDGWEDLWDEWI